MNRIYSNENRSYKGQLAHIEEAIVKIILDHHLFIKYYRETVKHGCISSKTFRLKSGNIIEKTLWPSKLYCYLLLFFVWLSFSIIIPKSINPDEEGMAHVIMFQKNRFQQKKDQNEKQLFIEYHFLKDDPAKNNLLIYWITGSRFWHRKIMIYDQSKAEKKILYNCNLKDFEFIHYHIENRLFRAAEKSL